MPFLATPVKQLALKLMLKEMAVSRLVIRLMPKFIRRNAPPNTHKRVVDALLTVLIIAKNIESYAVAVSTIFIISL